MQVYYLHGFASSPQSNKAAYLAGQLQPHGVTLRRPDFNQPDFSSLTISRMLAQLAADIATVGQPPIVLIGSSLGGVVAILAAAHMPDRIDRLVLLAPAVTFPRDAPRILGAERAARWRATGTLDVFHHADGALRPLSYGFYEDSVQDHVFAAEVPQPTLILQGVRDESVDYRMVARFAAARPNMQLTLLDDEHQLRQSLPRIRHDIAAFLELR